MMVALARVDRDGEWFVMFPADVEPNGNVTIFTRSGHTSGPLDENLASSRQANAAELEEIIRHLKTANYELAEVMIRDAADDGE